MAKEISRAFDTNLAAVIVTIQDDLGNNSVHTIHVANVTTCVGCGYRMVTAVAGGVDVSATVTKIIQDVDAASSTIRNAMIAAGWSPSP